MNAGRIVGGINAIDAGIDGHPGTLWRTRLRTLFASGRVRVAAGLMVLLVIRVAYLLACPMELIPDEAYYWDWSRQLDWSYYSKPPLIAWLIAAATAVGGDSEFSIRLPATIMGTAGLWLVYEQGRRMYSHKTGVWALLVVAASPGTTVLCLLMTIDAPFLLMWTASVYCLWRMLEGDEIDVRWLAPAIVATGTCLLSKQTALGLFPLAGLFLASGKTDRSKLKSRFLWLWMLGSTACLLPVLWWNHTHGWITVGHTREHFDPQSEPLLRHLILFLEFTASQFGILSPLVCGLMLLVTAALLKSFANLPRRERFLLSFGGVPMLAVTALSCFQRVQPNWPVALHLSGVVLLAAWSCGDIPLSPRWDACRSWLSPAVVLGAVLSVAVGLVPFVIPASSLSGTKLDPTGRLRGWKEVADQVAISLNSFSHSDDLLVVAVTSRAPVSELAYYLPGKPRVYRWNSGETIDSQHDVWGGPKQGGGRDALIVTDDTLPVPPRLAEAFLTLDELRPVVVRIGPNSTRRFRVWRGGTLRAWPERGGPAKAVAGLPHLLSPARSFQ